MVGEGRGARRREGFGVGVRWGVGVAGVGGGRLVVLHGNGCGNVLPEEERDTTL